MAINEKGKMRSFCPKGQRVQKKYPRTFEKHTIPSAKSSQDNGRVVRVGEQMNQTMTIALGEILKCSLQ